MARYLPRVVASRLAPGVLLAALAAGTVACGRPDPPRFVETPPPSPVRLGAVTEIAFEHSASYANPFLDAALEAEIQGPDGSLRTLPGFYYGDGVWMVRFRPHLPGRWSYRYRFHSAGFERRGAGQFLTTEEPHHPDAQPMRRHPSNPYRWIDGGGRLSFPIGLQDCLDNVPRGRHPLFAIDGGSSGSAENQVSIEDYFQLYGKAGFDLFRFSQRNCSYELYSTLRRYNEWESRVTDTLLESARRNGFRVLFCFFGYHGGFYGLTLPTKVFGFLRARLWDSGESIENPANTATLEREKQFVSYAIARWGVFTDAWELLNERHASDAWIRQMVAHVRANDPGHKPVTTSWERPDLPEIDINAPHWYETEPEEESDRSVTKIAAKTKAFRKPVIVGEQGNHGTNWDPRSALRMRLRLWSALFEEISLVFWNISWAKDGGVTGIYLGPEERRYVSILRQAATALDGDSQPLAVTVSDPDAVRARGLSSRTKTIVYLHHFAGHSQEQRGLTVSFQSPAGTAVWLDPATGERRPAGLARPGPNTFIAPPFLVDLALLIE